MKLYLALNEAGSRGDLGLHARLAVLSALNNTSLQPVMLYAGDRTETTRWLERHGVQVIDRRPAYLDAMLRLESEGRYSTAALGNWLRTEICLTEQSDEHVLYADSDVVFFGEPDLHGHRPRFLAAAPEFEPDRWNYFNSGILLMNVKGLRSDYRDFTGYAVRMIEEHGQTFHDQIAFNTFYDGRWDRLPVTMNWKPYWGRNERISVLHFHGPKFGALRAIADGAWDWSSAYGVQLGSLFASAVGDYEHFIRRSLASAPGLPQADIDELEALIERIAAYRRRPVDPRIDLAFTEYKLFPDRS